MSTRRLARVAGPLELSLVPAASRGRAGAALALALLAHAGLAAVALQQEAPRPQIVDVTQVDLLPPAAPAPPPPPPPALEPPSSEPPRAAAAPRARSRALPKTPPASAAPLRTIDEATATPDEPVRFVTDPNGAAFGFGTVARGGTAASAFGPVSSDAPPVPRREPAAVALGRAPRLAESDPCRGYFPARASVDRGEVALRVRVERDGSVRAITVVTETPLGHGFGFAARDCLRAKRFEPALDPSGREVAVVSPITVRFKR